MEENVLRAKHKTQLEKVESLEEYSKEELIAIVQDYRKGHWSKSLEVLKQKKNQIEDQFSKYKIDPRSDDGDKLFDNFMKWVKQVKVLNADIDEISAKIDPSIKEELRKRQEASNPLSPEGFAKRRQE